MSNDDRGAIHFADLENDELKITIEPIGYISDIRALAAIAGIDISMKNPHEGETMREEFLRIGEEVMKLHNAGAIDQQEGAALMMMKSWGWCQITNELRQRVCNLIERLAQENINLKRTVKSACTACRERCESDGVGVPCDHDVSLCELTGWRQNKS